jgi:hypothetical protein
VAPRAPARSRPSISPAAAAANKKPVPRRADRESAPSDGLAIEESTERRDADDRSREEAPVAAPVVPPNASTRDVRSPDPWDPNSFGDRR